MSFAESARRLAGLAGVLFGWRPSEFWQATPDELATLIVAMRGEPPAAIDRAELARLKEMFPDG